MLSWRLLLRCMPKGLKVVLLRVPALVPVVPLLVRPVPVLLLRVV